MPDEGHRAREPLDSRDRALVWRTTGGKHRYLLGDCTELVDDALQAFRAGILRAITGSAPLSLDAVVREHALLAHRIETFGTTSDGRDVWRQLGFAEPEAVPLMPTAAFLARTHADRLPRP